MSEHTTVLSSPSDVAAVAVESTLDVLQTAIAQKGSATWVLAGGTSPTLAYELISHKYRHALDWTKVTAIIGDERFVPVEHPDSNWGSIRPLLEELGLVVCMPEILQSVEVTAAAYNQQLRSKGIVEFDVAWVGVGEDGHTLSLFPGNPGFGSASKQLIIPIHDSPKPPADRISLSMATIPSIHHLIIFATGEAKQMALQRVRSGEALPIGVVANTVASHGGTIQWLYDQQAFGNER